jgi:acyl transferase domain-containing protein
LSYARAWAQGAQLDWSHVPGVVRGQLLPLPLPPFQRVRCWAKEAQRTAASHTASVTTLQRRELRPLQSAQEADVTNAPAALRTLLESLDSEPTVFLH